MVNYTFDILGVAPIFTFFNYQQQVENDRGRSLAYVGSPACTLDGLIQATELIPEKPDWDWDAVVKTIVDFWLHHEANIQQWRQELDSLTDDGLLVGRVANTQILRRQFERLL
ncbi:MAG: hypothetical protein VKJ27_13230 [Synechocystis sp.]|nr:hypothetical protein [Synechocystis sp.]